MFPNVFLLKIKLTLAVSVILMVLLGIASYITINRLTVASYERDQMEETVVLVERLATSLKTTESAFRQYMLTDKDVDEQEIAISFNVVRDMLSRLRKKHLLPEEVALEELTEQRITLVLQAVAAQKLNGREAAIAILVSDLNQNLRQQTGNMMDALRTREYLRLGDFQASAEATAKWVKRLIVATCLLLLGLLAWMVYLITYYEKKRALVELQLKDSEAMGRIITEDLAESVITTGHDDIVVDANVAALKLFGYEKSDLMGRDVSELMPEHLRSVYKASTAALRARPESFRLPDREMRSIRKDGSEILIKVSFGDVHIGGQRLFMAFMHDITERKRITEALLASEKQLRQITDTVPALIASLDINQRFIFHNKACEEVFGMSFNQIHGRTLAEVIGPKTYEFVQDKAEEALRGYVVHYERVQSMPHGQFRDYAITYFPRYGEGQDESKVIGFYTLGTDITELKRIDRMKSEFVSTVSHELRTPLTSIRGSLGLIAGGVVGELPEAVKTLVDIAKNNCERLIRLINDILDSEKIESGKMRMDLKNVDIKQVVRQALVASEGYAAQHRVRVQLQASDEPMQVCIDNDRMTQVLINLLSNAVKFSSSGSTVDVRVLRGTQGIRVEVADHGLGIPDDFRNHIFQKFSQADSSDARKKGGSGLGLSISKTLIEKMGGHISFTSALNVGSTFFFEVPEWQGSKSLPLPLPLKAPVTSLNSRILVCEGDFGDAKIISNMLVAAGFDTDIAHTAAQAQTFLENNSYAALTVNSTMPGQNALSFVTTLRSNEKISTIPVVMISTTVKADQVQFSRKRLLVSSWLEKPLNEKSLVSSVQQAISGNHNGKPRILHVEDDLDIQHIVGAMAKDFAIFEYATTLDEARTRLRTSRFDLVLLDLALEHESGWDLIDDINALNPRPPVIVFSASDSEKIEGKQVQAILVKARTSDIDLLNSFQRAFWLPQDTGSSTPKP